MVRKGPSHCWLGPVSRAGLMSRYSALPLCVTGRAERSLVALTSVRDQSAFFGQGPVLLLMPSPLTAVNLQRLPSVFSTLVQFAATASSSSRLRSSLTWADRHLSRSVNCSISVRIRLAISVGLSASSSQHSSVPKRSRLPLVRVSPSFTKLGGGLCCRT